MDFFIFSKKTIIQLVFEKQNTQNIIKVHDEKGGRTYEECKIK